MKLLSAIILLTLLNAGQETKSFHPKSGFIVRSVNGVAVDSVFWKKQMDSIARMKDDKLRVVEYEKIYKMIKK